MRPQLHQADRLSLLVQIQQEFERNERLKQTYPDVLWADPRREAPRWSREHGIVVKRKARSRPGA
jgi:hypothetical protein